MADARLGAQALEIIASGTSETRLAAISTEALVTSPQPESRIAGVQIDVLATTTPVRRFVATSYIEVLTPAAEAVFIGWGVPL